MENRTPAKSNADGSESSDSATRSGSSALRPNYLSEPVKEALKHLASINLIDLCHEAKVERCRANKDLRSCGHYVLHVLNSCGHASLCAECSQQCEFCPICRIPIPKNDNRLRLRLYYECIDAGLISKKIDERLLENENGENRPTVNVDRLYSLFDVAMENNLVTLIGHYITDVCMDEAAVSSDPAIAILLDEVVVKNWCKRAFRNIIAAVQGIYSLQVEKMEKSFDLLHKFSAQLAGICYVLEVLESSLKATLSTKLQDVHDLQESTSKTKQHMEIMMWCLRHQFLENVRSRHTDLSAWRSLVRERKSAAIKRAWPDSVNTSSEPSVQDGSLFIEDALLNLEIEEVHAPEMEEEMLVPSLHKDGAMSVFRSKIEGVSGSYPFQNLRTATDILFLNGSSDLVVAKRAIFLYYLFDRYWTMPSENWRHIVDDFASTFGVTRHSLLECLTFYLLDDHMDEAMQEACRLLPEISGPGTHPKVAQVLLERQNPDAALMVLRWSGRDGGARLVSLSEAVTAVRVRVESGLLTEAFMHQRTLCMKVKEKNMKQGVNRNELNDSNNELRSWVEWTEALVTEICCLCIRRNLVDRMVDLPWNSDEEKYLHKFLLDYATESPATTLGSLLVVFYLKRYRYVEAYQVHHLLHSVEQDFIAKHVDEEVLLRIRSSSHWRAGLVDKSIEFLPDIQRQQLKAGKMPDIGASSGEENKLSMTRDSPIAQPASSSLLIPSSIDSSLILQLDHAAQSMKIPEFENQFNQSGAFNNPSFGFGKDISTSLLPGPLFSNAERRFKPQMALGKNFKLDGISTPGAHPSPTVVSPLKEFSRSSARVMKNSNLRRDRDEDEVLPEYQENEFIKSLQNSNSPYSYKGTTDPIVTTSSNLGLFNDSAQDGYSNLSGRRALVDRPWIIDSTDDPMDASWSNGGKSVAAEETNANGVLRWRSDDSDNDEEQSPVRSPGVASHTTPMRGIRRSRFAKK